MDEGSNDTAPVAVVVAVFAVVATAVVGSGGSGDGCGTGCVVLLLLLLRMLSLLWLLAVVVEMVCDAAVYVVVAIGLTVFVAFGDDAFKVVVARLINAVVVAVLRADFVATAVGAINSVTTVAVGRSCHCLLLMMMMM